MKAISQKEIIELISDINSFADGAENLINTTQANYNQGKQALQSKHSSEDRDLSARFNSNRRALQARSQNILSSANNILNELNYLDNRLSALDKYYLRTKKKKKERLSGVTDHTYDSTQDFFAVFDQIEKKFNDLYKKYTEKILPSFINGVHYIFSSQRKKDYEDLIVLRQTVAALVMELQRELPEITQDNLSALNQSESSQRDQMHKSHANEMGRLESAHSSQLDDVALKIYDALDEILPDELVEYLYLLIARYNQNVLKVNSGSTVLDEVVYMGYLDFPVDFFVQSSIVASVIKEKCKKLLIEDIIRFPFPISIHNAPAWTIINDKSGVSSVQAFTHSIMFGMLSSLPVSTLTYSIVDPENRGNSIAPYFDAKKRLPELFGEKIYIGKNDITEKIERLNEYIENVLQYRLGNHYDSIFDYAADNTEFQVQAELLVIYDFPKAFDEHMMAELRNILRNGCRCGIFTVISYLPDNESNYSNEQQKNISTILDLTTVIEQNSQEFTMRGLPMSYFAMPEKAEFAKFFSKYMLIFEGIKNRGIAFSPLIRKLMEARDSLELDKHINSIAQIMKAYDKNYAQVPDTNAGFPSLVTLGSVKYPADIFSESLGYEQIMKYFGVKQATEDHSGFVELPLTFDLKNTFNLFLTCPESCHSNMLDFTHHVIWSFLSFMPVTKVNVTIFDGERRGNSIIPFLSFRKRIPDLFDQKIYTNSDDMCERLKQIDSHIDDIIMNKLGNRYQTVFDYNAGTSNRSEPVTLLVLYDFPYAMESRSLDLLNNILRNGNKCGVFTVICYNPEISYSRYESIDDRLAAITRFCTTVGYKDGHYALQPYNLEINIPKMISSEAVDQFVDDYVSKSEEIKKRGLSFKDIITNNLFTLNSSQSMRIPIGVGDEDKIVTLDLGLGSSHSGLIAGAVGSGKSTLLHTLIMSSMLHYAPDQLHLYLMDFKGGTEFKIYESVRLPHLQLLALDAMQEFGESILEKLVQEMESRQTAFKNAGGVSKIKDYVDSTGKSMPRILIIMDEFQILFNDSTNRKVAMHCAELLKRLVTEGRAFGIHILMATQSTRIINDLTVDPGTIEQMRIRIGLKCGEHDARYLFSDNNCDKALEMMKGPIGTAVLNLDYTDHPNIGFRAAYCDKETQNHYLQLIAKTFSNVPCNLQIFEGNRTTNLLDYLNSINAGFTQSMLVSAYMGMPIKVAAPFEISVDRKTKHNLLICGANEQMANMLTANYMISVLLNRHTKVYCIDGETLVGDSTSQKFYDVLIRAGLPFKVAADRGDIIRFIREVYDIYQAHKKQNTDESVFVFIKNLQFLDIVKTMFKGDIFDESEYIDSEPKSENVSLDPFAAINSMFDGRETDDSLSVGDKLNKMVESGSGFGIHFIVSSLEYQTVRENMYYGENALSKFKERIIFSLGSNESENLIENVSVAGLRSNTVYYTDGIQKTFQFKPYISPSPSELESFLRKLK